MADAYEFRFIQAVHKYGIRESQRCMCYLLDKALYGMLRAAILFYHKLCADLEEIGFEINPYDPCVANRDVLRSQCTVVCHVDD